MRHLIIPTAIAMIAIMTCARTAHAQRGRLVIDQPQSLEEKYAEAYNKAYWSDANPPVSFGIFGSIRPLPGKYNPVPIKMHIQGDSAGTGTYYPPVDRITPRKYRTYRPPAQVIIQEKPKPWYKKLKFWE